MNIIECKKCHQPYEHTDENFYRTQGYLLKTCKTCMNARHNELNHAVRPASIVREPIVFPKATKHCPLCGYWYAPLPELWGMYNPTICRICEAPVEVAR